MQPAVRLKFSNCVADGDQRRFFSTQPNPAAVLAAQSGFSTCALLGASSLFLHYQSSRATGKQIARGNCATSQTRHVAIIYG